MAATINRTDLLESDSSAAFKGSDHGAGSVSFFWVESEPGHGPRLHRHAYSETFVVMEGEVHFTVGDEVIVAKAGDIVVCPPDTPHRFLTAGTGISRQLNIHDSSDFVTEWLED